MNRLRTFFRRLFCRHEFWPAGPEEMLEHGRYVAYCSICGRREGYYLNQFRGELAQAQWHANIDAAEKMAKQRINSLNKLLEK